MSSTARPAGLFPQVRADRARGAHGPLTSKIAQITHKIALWEHVRLQLLCKLRARVSDTGPDQQDRTLSGSAEPQKSATKETEP
ncbi:hypothetical protein [Streptomyces sp. NPDC051561]|uniref:hypothetical protein n=1 Tax=Streptomyces sp. NPDC051561 TaxID=3365658 RepID=UPI0037964C49